MTSLRCQWMLPLLFVCRNKWTSINEILDHLNDDPQGYLTLNDSIIHLILNTVSIINVAIIGQYNPIAINVMQC